MDNKQPSMSKSAINFGLILGLILVVISLLTYLFRLYESTDWLSWVSIVVLAGGIYVGTKNYRDNVKGGFISYGNALGFGTLVALFSGIVSAIFAFVYLGYIDSSFIEFSVTKAEDQMYEQGLPEEQIEMSLKYTKMFLQPFALAIMGIFMNTFLGFIISLITGAILKKEPKEFA